MNILRKIFLIPVHFYRKFISPFKPPCCRYYPTCSTYAVQAVERFGIVRGTILAVWRILRCNPWSKGGIDYVPQEFPLKLGKREKKKY